MSIKFALVGAQFDHRFLRLLGTGTERFAWTCWEGWSTVSATTVGSMISCRRSDRSGRLGLLVMPR